MVAAGAFIAMLVALAADKTDLIVIQGFVMVSGCVLSLHQAPRSGSGHGGPQ